MRKPDLFFLAVILFISAALRVWAPWGDVFPSTALGASGATRINFLETDAWYHVRLVENQVRNFPHHITVDPYAAPDGQFVAVAPLFDAAIATVVFVTRGPSAPTAYIERVAALAPPIMGVLAVAAVWALATIAFDRRANLIAAFLAAVLPGHFLDRTLVGFVDHHALEVLLSFATLAALAWLVRSPGAWSPTAAGVCLGLYLLAWSSGAFLVAILTGWIVVSAFVGEQKTVVATARGVALAAIVALALVLLLQNPAMFRYNTQIASLVGLLSASAIVALVSERKVFRSASSVSSAALLSLSVASAALLVAAYVWAPDLVRQVTSDLSRFRPDPTRMAVLEARPLFLYTGNWDWLQPWTFFRSGFYIGALALIALAFTIWRSRRLDHLLIVIFTAAAFIATIGQNRFGYYLVPATAVVIGWLSVRVLDWGGVPHAGNPMPNVRVVMPLQREVAVILVAGLAIAPNLVPAALTTTRAGGMADYWANAMEWLRASTPPPFGSDALYNARYGDTNPAASYTVMNWWDQGYWIVQAGHRVPVSNPTQVRAPNAAAFYTATDEAAALAMLSAERARYVLVDWELPFRQAGAGALGGRFQNLADWAGIPTSRFYSLCYTQASEGDPWQPIWLFHEPYYQSMVYRLMVAGGGPVVPANSTYVVTVRDRTDSTGRQFCEVAGRQVFANADAAKAAAEKSGAGARVVGLSPWQPAFPVPPITGLRIAQEFRESGQKPNETPMVRIFEVVK
ncbi:MAG: STT3 domain-containing protein [Acidobacteriota bacterium]|nr:STT3 domain-containing protein [Acidobacteriota bacterium]